MDTLDSCHRLHDGGEVVGDALREHILQLLTEGADVLCVGTDGRKQRLILIDDTLLIAERK